ncbi:inositol polyphosphate multikinase IPK2 [Drosophila subobscura]|uniref:inositol polyphosphate multikinase IPK2 n=1 Tax=Drosophila subobscura TaxID=7241 RepID=UPI00155A5516|nr:inositol polyphosphate multikinase IPK2 [Drosophila subobscura]
MARKDQEAVQLPRPALPVGFRQFATQVAGHTFEATNAAAVGLLQDSVEGCVLKPLGKPECEVRELNFYESLASAAAAAASAAGSMTEAKAAPGDNDLAALGRHVPRFYGHLKLVVNQREHTFVRLEDLTRGMQQPCVMDVKMGRRTWDPLSSPHKRQVEEQKYVICKQKLGLCLPGFLVYLPAEEPGKTVLMRHGKDYGKSLNVAGFRQTMGIFFNASTSDSKTRAAGTEVLLREVLRQLQEILAWFKRQRLLHFYASSLLICYDYARLSSAAETQPAPLLNGHHHHHAQPCADDASEWVRVRMIDFAHVYPAEDGQPDENYMFGLQSLIEVVESILYR